jgi:hypothetical protein
MLRRIVEVTKECRSFYIIQKRVWFIHYFWITEGDYDLSIDGSSSWFNYEFKTPEGAKEYLRKKYSLECNNSKVIETLKI